MRFSIIIATLDREIILQKAIDSILAQTYKDFEIIIIDQSEKSSERIPKDPRIVYTNISQKGLSHARNIGIEISKGEIIGLMDDDAEYSPDVLEKVHDYFSSNKSVVALSGKLIDPETKKVSLNGMPNESGPVNFWNVLNRCISTTMFIKRSFLENEKFDEDFGIGSKWGSGEETDIVLRSIYTKGNVWYFSDVLVFHPATNKREMSFDKLKKYSKGFGALAQKHKMKYNNNVFYMRCCIIVIKQLIGMAIFALRFDNHMVEYYWNSYKYKRVGMKDYKKENKES